MTSSRMFWQNFAIAGATAIAASSFNNSHPARRLRDPMRSNRWRSASGWTLVQGFNDALTFDEGTTTRVAYLTGNYPTGAAAATALTSAMAAAGIDPLEMSPSLWLRADSLTDADGATLTSWADSSGNGRNQTNVVGTPKMVRSAANGRPAVRFDDLSYLYGTATMADLLDGSGRGLVLAVVWCDTDHSGPSPVFVDAADRRRLAFSGTDLVARAYDGTNDDATKASAVGQWLVVAWQYDGTNVLSFSNDQDTAAAASAASGAQTDLTQVFRLGGDGTNNLKGYIAELVVVPGTPSEEDRRRLTAYAKQKYVITESTTAPTWTNTVAATYSSTTSKFTLARTAGAATIGLPWTKTPWAAQGMGKDLGFDVTADDTGATSYAADLATYQSRHYVTFDLGSAQDIYAAFVLDHNSDTGGTYRVQASTLLSTAVTAPVTTQVLDNSSNKNLIRARVFAFQTYRFWAIVIEDQQNADGFAEFGVPYLGAYLTLDLPARGIDREPVDYSAATFADQGAAFQDRKQRTRRWSYSFEVLAESVANEVDTAATELLTGGSFFFHRDPEVDAGAIVYAILPQLPKIKHMTNSADRWAVELLVQEALG